MPFSASASMQPTFSSAESKSQIVVEKREDVVKPNVAVSKSPPKDGEDIILHSDVKGLTRNVHGNS